ncbi:MAG: hypothetical protein ABI818_01585 [Acidobacteriota bacterium]
MLRSLLRPVVTLLLLTVAAPVWAADRAAEAVAPSAAVAAAWAAETSQRGPSSTALKALYASYGALQTLDMASTVAARNRGAREVNPMLDGSYGHATATKALMAAASIAAVQLVAKKSKKAAFVTMIALNVASAAVVVNNLHNAHQLSQR